MPRSSDSPEGDGWLICLVYRAEENRSDLAVFDALASDDKRMHANPGLHPEIPAEEIDFSFDFMLDHINGERTRRVVNPLAE